MNFLLGNLRYKSRLKLLLYIEGCQIDTRSERVTCTPISKSQSNELATKVSEVTGISYLRQSHDKFQNKVTSRTFCHS